METVTRRELAGASAVAVVLAVVTTWPLLIRIGSHVPGDLGDPLLQAWQLAWSGHAALPGGPALLDTNAWHPLADTFAFSDPPLGYAPAAVGADSIGHAVVVYNLVFLAVLVLAWIGPYLLARELSAPPLAAAVAAAAVAYAPWRLAHAGHLNVLSTGGIAVSLALLVHGARRDRPWVLLAGWVVAAWQLTVSVSTGVPFATLLGVLALAAAVAWWQSGRARPALVAAGGGAVLFGAVGAWRAGSYLRVLEAHPEAVRTVGHLDVYSPPLTGLLAAPPESWVWGGATAGLREGMAWPPEQAVLPGLVVVALAAYGAVRGAGSRRLRLGLAAATTVTVLLTLGTTVAGGRLSYLPLFQHVPGWSGLRTPGRLIAFASLGLALLAALGATRIVRRIGATRGPATGRAVTIAVVGLVLVEGLGTTPVVPVPQPSPAVATAPGPRLHLPSGGTVDHRYLLWSVAEDFPPLVNGTGAFVPDILARVRAATTGFPDDGSVALLADLGVHSVVWHRDLAAGTPWAEVATRTTAGLPVTRRTHGDVVVFELTE